MITGKITAREVKLPFVCSVVKCPISTDKSKIEFPSLPETEFTEVVVQITNSSAKDYIVETVPPHPDVCGIMVNPLVIDLKSGRSALVCIRYKSEFRDLTLKKMEELFKPKDNGNSKPGLGNKKILERQKKEKEEAQKEAPVDLKAKPGAKAPAPAPAKKAEEVKKPDPKSKKTP